VFLPARFSDESAIDPVQPPVDGGERGVNALLLIGGER
jgi:hypothetical protein